MELWKKNIKLNNQIRIGLFKGLKKREFEDKFNFLEFMPLLKKREQSNVKGCARIKSKRLSVVAIFGYLFSEVLAADEAHWQREGYWFIIGGIINIVIVGIRFIQVYHSH